MRVLIILNILFFSCKLSAVEIKNGIVVFNNAEEALPYVFKASWNYVNAPLAPASYKKVELALDDLYAPLCQKFKDCKNFPRPIIMLSNNGLSASFGLIFNQTRRQSNILIISEELVFNQKNLEFVIAHELVHYFSLHAETSSPASEIYDIYKSEQGSRENFKYPFDVVKFDLLQLLDLMQDLGPRAHLIASGHALSVSGNLGKLTLLMAHSMENYNGDCKGLVHQLRRLEANQTAGNYLSSTDQKVLKFLKDANSCFEKFQGNLIEEISRKEGIFSKEQGKVLEIIKQDSNELKRLQQIHSLKMESYTILSQKLGGPKIRLLNEEDFADLKALELLLSLGKSNMEHYIGYLLTDASPRGQLKCFSELEAGREPFYGVLTNPHHHECWRVWRAKKFEEDYREKQNSKPPPESQLN